MLLGHDGRVRVIVAAGIDRAQEAGVQEDEQHDDGHCDQQDDQRKREDPDFKGAFHDKKWVIKAKAAGKKVPQKKAVTKAGPKGGAVQGPKPVVRNNRPGKNAKFRPGAASNKKKR